MAQRCTVCTHPKRDEINKALTQASDTLAGIAQRYGLTKSAVDRHKANHLKLSLQAVQEQRNALTIIGYAQDLYERAGAVLERAETVLEQPGADSRSVQAAAASLREVRGAIELLAKLVTVTPEAPPETADAWIDQAIRQELEAMRPPELPAAPDDVVDAVVVQEPG